VILYGLNFALNYRPGGDKTWETIPLVWSLLAPAWLIIVLYAPLPAYYLLKGRDLNPYFSDEAVFRGVFVVWYGCIGALGLLVVALGSHYGGLISLGLLLGIILAGRGLRLLRLVEYGSTCASLFVFSLASEQVPPRLWLPCYAGIGLVQCFFLAALENVFSEAFFQDIPKDPDTT
jgi:hypothetical protein